MSEPFIGIITVGAFNYAPLGWALCDGQILSASQNQALFALLGNTFGGTYPITFGLPDLRGRATVTTSTTAGHLDANLTPHTLGSQGGKEAVPLTIQQIPIHTHIAYAVESANQVSPAGHVWGGDMSYPVALYAPGKGTPTATLNPRALQTTGGGQPHANMSPFLVMPYIIALEGYFPWRD